MLYPYRARKGVNSLLDFGFDWAEWLNAGDTIAESAWTITPADVGGLAVLPGSDAHTDTATVVRAMRGAAGRIYRLTNRITTADGLVDERTILVTAV